MVLVNKGITAIDFDDTYFLQTQLQQFFQERFNFQNVDQVHLLCNDQSLSFLNNKLRKRKKRGITFIGSGDYHYVTYLLLKEITKPFTLVLFDNHLDIGVGILNKKILTCGSWVSHALKDIPLLQQVLIIGPTVNYQQESLPPRTIIFPYKENFTISSKQLLSKILMNHVYISIDKDVLHTKIVQTNWDQGLMNLETLTHLLQQILFYKQVEGIDICGEVHLKPLQKFEPKFQQFMKKNEKANIAILQTCLHAYHNQMRGA